MATLGTVTRTQTGAYKGYLKTLHVHADIDIVPVGEKSGPSFPDFRVVSAGVELGAGWLNTGQVTGREYLSVTLSHPDLGPRTIKCQLGRAAGQDDDDVFALIWNPED